MAPRELTFSLFFHLLADLLATYTPNLTCNGSSRTPKSRESKRAREERKRECEREEETRGWSGVSSWPDHLWKQPVATSCLLFAHTYLPLMYYYVLRRRTASRWPWSRLEPKLRFAPASPRTRSETSFLCSFSFYHTACITVGSVFASWKVSTSMHSPYEA